MLFGAAFTADPVILLLILIAKFFQAYIFILINYKGAMIDRGMAYLVVAILAAQSLMFLTYHDSLIHIAVDILLPSLAGSLVLLGYILHKKTLSPLDARPRTIP